MLPKSKKLQTTIEMWLLNGFKIQITEKTWWENVKLLILSNYTFFHNVFLKVFVFNVLKLVYMEERVNSFTTEQINRAFSLAKNALSLAR